MQLNKEEQVKLDLPPLINVVVLARSLAQDQPRPHSCMVASRWRPWRSSRLGWRIEQPGGQGGGESDQARQRTGILRQSSGDF
jgi:hypothetical protein